MRSVNAKLALVRAYGSDPIACSTLQPHLEYVETSFGYVAYRRALGLSLALGPPICAPEDRQELIEKFVRRVRRPTFMYLRRDDALLAAAITESPLCGFGVDKLLSLDRPHDDDARVRGALKKAARDAFELHELRGPAETTLRVRLDEITQSYLKRSAVPVEMGFINRPLSLEDELARLFVMRQRDGHVFGYAVLDPWFVDGRVDGYLLNLVRFEQTRIWGVYFATVARLIDQLRVEGVRRLSLGFSPLTDVDTSIAGCSRALALQARFMERRFARVAYVARLREMKEAFTGFTEHRYVVTPTRNGAHNVLALAKACGVPLAWLIGPQLADALLKRAA